MKILWSFVVLVALLYKLIAIQTVSISITTSTTFILLFLFFIFIKHLSYLIYTQTCIKFLQHRLISIQVSIAFLLNILKKNKRRDVRRPSPWNTLTLRIAFMKSSSKFLLDDLGEYISFSLTNKYVEEE